MRISTSIVTAYLWLTAAANLLLETGISQSMGITTDISAGARLVEAREAFSTIEAKGIAVESMIGVFITIAKVIEAMAAGLFAGPNLLLNLGIPMPIVAFVFAPIPLIAGRAIIYALSGRSI
jgi:hypothetical protein